MKRVGILDTNLCFFLYEDVVFDFRKLHHSILHKKCDKKVYGVDIKQFETLKWWPAQKTLFKIENTPKPLSTPFEVASSYEPLEAIYLDEIFPVYV